MRKLYLALLALVMIVALAFITACSDNDSELENLRRQIEQIEQQRQELLQQQQEVEQIKQQPEETNVDGFDIIGEWRYSGGDLGAIVGFWVDFYLVVESFDGEAIVGSYFYHYLTNQHQRVSEYSGRFYLNRTHVSGFGSNVVVYDYYYEIYRDNFLNTVIRLVVDREKGLNVLSGTFVHPLTRVNDRVQTEAQRAELIVGSWRETHYSFFPTRGGGGNSEVILTFNEDLTYSSYVYNPYRNSIPDEARISGTISGRYRIDNERLMLFERTSHDVPNVTSEKSHSLIILEDTLVLRRTIHDGERERLLVQSFVRDDPLRLERERQAKGDQILGRWREIEVWYNNRTTPVADYEDIWRTFFEDGTFKCFFYSPHYPDWNGTIFGQYLVDGDQLITFNRTSYDIINVATERTFTFNIRGNTLTLESVDEETGRIFRQTYIRE